MKIELHGLNPWDSFKCGIGPEELKAIKKDSNSIEVYQIENKWTFHIHFITANRETELDFDYGECECHAVRDQNCECFALYDTKQHALEAGLEKYFKLRIMDYNHPNMYLPNRKRNKQCTG